MEKYPKIQTVWTRDPETKFKTLIEGEWARPEFWYLSECPWLWTEKIDGTNIRVQWSPEDGVRFGGRTENAQIPAFLVSVLQDLFGVEKMLKAYPETSMCLYGEGYGARIQKGGGNYISDGVSFILFDVHCGDVWLQWSDVVDVASTLDIDVVPVVGQGGPVDAIDMTRGGFASRIGTAQAEGLVMRPLVDLQNRRGDRVIAKVKTKDFGGGER